MGIKDAKAKELLKNHNEEYILANIRVVEEELKRGKKIRNVPAYLMKAFEVDFRPAETELQKLLTKKKKQSKLEEKAAEEWAAKRKALLKKFEKQKAEAVAKVLGDLSNTETTSLKAEFLEDIEKNPLLKKVLEAKGLDSKPIQAHWINFIAQRYLEKTASDFTEFLKIEGYDTKGGEI